MQTSNSLGKKLLGVSIAWSLALILLPRMGVFAQTQEGQRPPAGPGSEVRSLPAAAPAQAGPKQQDQQSRESPKSDAQGLPAEASAKAAPGQETNAEVPEAPATPPPPPDYVIGPEDVLSIDVFNVPELNKTVRVANDGTITLPLLGQLRASGLTAGQLRNELQSDWGKTYLQNPQVTVFLQEFHSRPVSVIGAILKPGLYTLTAPRTLVEMISLAGGTGSRTSIPAGKFVYVTRKSGFEDLEPAEGMRLIAPNKVEIELRRLLYSHEDALNIEIKPEDIISVSRADVVYVGGNGVKVPGAFPLEDRDSVTVLQALAMAQGLSPNARRANARIIHTEPDGSRKMVRVNLKRLEKGKSPDLVLANNDILFVPDSTQMAVLKGGATTVVSTLSWLLIYGRI